AWACGSQAAISSCPGMVVGLDGSQLTETRFTFRPTSFSVPKNETPPSPVLPASSVTPTSNPARAAPAEAHASAAHAHSSSPLVLVTPDLLDRSAANNRFPRSSARGKRLLSPRGRPRAACRRRTYTRGQPARP